MRFAETAADGFPVEIPDSCDHDNHVDYSEDRSLLRGSPLDVARWLLCSEGWLHDAWALDEYVAFAFAEGRKATVVRRILDAEEAQG